MNTCPHCGKLLDQFGKDLVRDLLCPHCGRSLAAAAESPNAAEYGKATPDPGAPPSVLGNIPKIRTWSITEGDSRLRTLNESDPVLLAKAHAWNILRGISNAFVPIDSRARQAERRYDCDWCLFELCCYAIYRTGIWLVENRQQSFRRRYHLPICVPYCMNLIEHILQVHGLVDLYLNRQEIYFRELQKEGDSIERELLYLTQLLHRTAGNTMPVVKDLDSSFAIYVQDIRDEGYVKTCIHAYLSAWFPQNIEVLEYIIRKLTQLGRLG